MSEASTAAPTQAAPQGTTDPATQAAQNAPGQAPTGATTSAGTVKEAAQEVMRKHRVRVEGQEIEVDEEELKRGYGHQRAANKILQEGKTFKKQAESFISMLKDPDKLEEVLQKLGHDPRKLFESRLADKIRVEVMTKEEREQYDRDLELKSTKAKLREYEDMKAKEEQAVKDRHHNEMKEKFKAEYNTTFVEAIKTTAVPPTKETVAKMAAYISRSVKIGVELTPLEAAKMVEDDFRQLYTRVASQADGETLLKMFGDDFAQKILTARGARVKSPNLPTPQEQGQRRDRKTTNIGDKERRRLIRGWG